jgi:drug/metabolite transporter (DMT)-like permease
MNWLIFTILACLLYAVVGVFNKYLLGQRATTKPIVFTFWLGILSIFSFVLIPFGLAWPGWPAFGLDIVVGIVYFFAILYFYEALDINEASRVSSLAGGLTPIMVLFFSLVLLNESLVISQLVAFFLLVAGAFLISFKKSRGGLIKGSVKGLWFMILTIILSAIYWVAEKYVFEGQGFVTGFLWTRLGFILTAVAILVWPAWRRKIFYSESQLTLKISSLFITSKLFAAFGSLFIHLALSLGSASLVNALGGMQYVFLLILAIILSKKFPDFLKEETSGGVLVQKIAAVMLIVGGLAILAF